MTNGDWCFEVEDFKIVVGQSLGRQVLHEADPVITFSGRRLPVVDAEGGSPPDLGIVLSKEKAIELAHRILEEWE